MKMVKIKNVYAFIGVIFLFSIPLSAVWAESSLVNTAVTGESIVKNVENRLWGQSNHGTYSMTIETPYWHRTLELEAWMQRPLRTLVRIHLPKKEAGVGSLRIGNEMWNYLPKVDRTIKVPPSMMLQPWMGSDFSNDDLVKESSLLNDYTHKLTLVHNAKGEALYHVVSIPKPDAAVVWGRVELWVKKKDLIPVKQGFFDERGALVKQLTYDKVKKMGGRLLPTRWTMQPAGKTNQKTTLIIKTITFNQPISRDVFSLRRLRQAYR